MGNSLPANAGYTGEVGLILGLGRSPGVENVNPLWFAAMKNPMDSLVGYSPKGHKESDMTE